MTIQCEQVIFKSNCYLCANDEIMRVLPNQGTVGESVTKRLAFPSGDWPVQAAPGTLDFRHNLNRNSYKRYRK